MNIIQKIAEQSIGKGNTTWILKSIITNPNVIVICKDIEFAQELERAYKIEIRKKPFYKRIYWKLTKRPEPFFYAIHTKKIQGSNRPVIFDNGCFI